MSAFQNIGISQYFKRYGIRYGIKRALFMKMPLYPVNDYENRKVLYYYKAKAYLARKYKKYSMAAPDGLEFGNGAVDNPVWVYWKQGIDNAPLLVKKCVESIRKNSSRPVIVLDDNSVHSYVKLPDSITKKYNAGSMSDAALSDMIRFSLLEHFGGTWIDATVLMTSDLPTYIQNADFFAFRDTFGLINNPALISNWLLHCKKGNIVMKTARNMTFAYWEHEKYVIDYLFTYMLLNIALEDNLSDVGNYPYANSDYSHLLLDCLDEQYDEKKMNHICELSGIQKLTYKLREDVMNQDGTFLKYILEDIK